MMSTSLLKRSDMSIYNPLVTDVRDQYYYGIDVYLKALTSARDMLEDYARIRKLYPKKRKKKTGKFHNKDGGQREGPNAVPEVMHAQENLVAGNNGNT